MSSCIDTDETWAESDSCTLRLQRLVKDLLKKLQDQDSSQWASNKVSGLDRTLGEITRILEKQVEQQTGRSAPQRIC